MTQALRRARMALAAATFILAPALAFAQDSPQALRQEIDQLRLDFEALKQQYGERLAALESKLAAAGGTPAEVPLATVPPAAVTPVVTPQPAQPTAQVPPGAEGAGGPTGSLPVYGGAAAGSKIFNPDIAVIGNFLGAAGRNVEQPSPALEMHESEASFQAIVDPYGRADFFFAFGEEGVDLEEGYLTLTTLPGGWLTKVGKMREAFGKVNTMHSHQLPWTDRPLVSQNLVGGEEGIADAGMSVARLIPNPWLFLEATGQVYRGDSGLEEQPVFVSGKPGNVSYVGSSPRVPRPHGSEQHRPWGLLRAGPQRCRSGEHRIVRHGSVRRRRDVPVEAAPAIDLPLVRGADGMDSQPTRPAARTGNRRRVLRLG